MNVLVVGARGFVGVRLVCELLERGHAVVAMDIRGELGPLAPFSEQIKWVTGDAADPETMLSVIDEFHLNALYYGPFFRVDPSFHNLGAEWRVMGGGALSLFSLTRALPLHRIVFPSSTAVHGHQPNSGDVLNEDSPVRPFMVYGATKLLCEYFAQEVNRELKANRIVSVRLPSIYGPGADIASRGVNIFPVQAARGLLGKVACAADARVCVAHVADAARFISDLLEAPTCDYDLYELGGHDVSFGEIAASVKHIIPEAELHFGSSTDMPLPHAVSCERAMREFELRHVPFEQGIRSIVEFEKSKQVAAPLRGRSVDAANETEEIKSSRDEGGTKPQAPAAVAQARSKASERLTDSVHQRT